jgi:molecular chaperone DnaK
VVRVGEQCLQVVANEGDVRLGGIEWNNRLLEYVADEFKARYGVDLRQSPVAVQMLRHDCDVAKTELSAEPKTSIGVRFEGKSLRVGVKQLELNAVTDDLVERCAELTRRVLQQARLAANALDDILLAGGSTSLPQVHRMLQTLTGKDPRKTDSPQSLAAHGAAIYAAMLEASQNGHASALDEKTREMLAGITLKNVNTHGLGILLPDPKTKKEANHVLVPQNTALGARVHKTFKTSRLGQDHMSFQLVEGDAVDPAACRPLGKCRIAGLSTDLAVGTPIDLACAFDLAGRISVSASEKTSGKPLTVEIHRASGLTDAQVEAYRRLTETCKVE